MNSVRCFHDPSGAMGKSEDQRSKEQNTKRAWRRCIDSIAFKEWLKVEIARATGSVDKMMKKIDKEMKTKVQVQVKDENGRWVDEDTN